MLASFISRVANWSTAPRSNSSQFANRFLFSIAAGGGLAEHVAPFDATIQIISGKAMLTVGDKSVKGKQGTWIQMAAKTPHSIKAETPVLILLTLLK